MEVRWYWGNYVFIVAALIKMVHLIFQTEYGYAFWIFMAVIWCALAFGWEKMARMERTWK